MVSEDTWLIDNSLLILNFFFIFFILWWKTKFLIMELIVSFPDDIEVSSNQSKRFNESVNWFGMFVENCSNILLFDNILSFSSNIIFSCILQFLFEKYGLHAFQNYLELQSTLSFSKYCNLTYSFRFANRFCCHLNLTNSLGFSDLFALFLRHDLIIISFESSYSLVNFLFS